MDKKTKLKDSRTVRRYSNAFKQKVLDDLESGRKSKREVCRDYGIGKGTIYSWMRKFGRLDLYNPRLIIQMPEERDKYKLLQQELDELKEALVQTQLRAIRAESDLEVALEMLGTTKEVFSKKPGASHLEKPSKKAKK